MDAGDEDGGGDVGVTREDAAILMTLKHGTKRKRRRAELSMRARSSALQVQGVRWISNLRARSSPL